MASDEETTAAKKGEHKIGVSNTVATASLPLNVNGISGSELYHATAAVNSRGWGGGGGGGG